MTRTVLTTATVVAALAAAPAAAQAATVTVTGDGGTPVAAPATIRNMDVQVVTTVTAAETPAFRTQVLGPDGVAASTQSSCRDTSILTTTTQYADYRGNGVYKVAIQLFSDAACTTLAATGAVTYTVLARVAVAQPNGIALTRPGNSFTLNVQRLGFAPNPGAGAYEVRYRRGGRIGAGGAIVGASKEAFVDRATNTIPLRFDKPGTWVVVARAKRGSSASPWSAPVRVQAIAPFDLVGEEAIFTDSMGPSYRLKGTARERAAAGKRVTISLAKGKRGGTFRRIGRPKVKGNGTFSLRFTVRDPGVYRLRYVYKSHRLILGSKITQPIRVRRTFV